MAEDFLFELGVEEMPARVVTPSMNQLKERMTQFLEDSRLSFDSIDAFSTPRRLAVRVNGLSECQADIEEEAKGPAMKIAKDEEGNWSKAAQGFVRGQGMTVDDIYTKEVKGTEYIFVQKKIEGKPATEILQNIMEAVVEKMTFPTMMHWGSGHFKFIRPIKWIVALYGTQILPIEFLGLGATNMSRGHRFLGAEVMIPSPKGYEQALMSQYVLVDPMMRKTRIMEQMVDFATNNQWKIDFDEDLLEEVNNLVEFPTSFVGTFDEKYLDIPSEVLITSMKEHQRYFEVYDVEGNLLPYFISVRNGDLEHIENVILGNEKVLTARLEDAEFFYQEDQKQSIDDWMQKLKNVTFHEKIGMMTQKMERVSQIANHLIEVLNIDESTQKAIRRASDIYKFDLVTGMVDEFPELQGIMGEKYALLQGETEAVAAAIREHYLPISTEGVLPETVAGAVLALADKWDSLMSFFTVGLVPTGSNDPYALRRQAYGMVRIIENFGWTLSIQDLFNWSLENVKSEDDFKYDVTSETVIEFMDARVKQLLQRENIRYDVIEAVLNSHYTDINHEIEVAHLLNTHINDEDLKVTVESFNRVSNLAQKAEKIVEIDEALFENDAEKALYDAYTALTEVNDLEAEYTMLKNLQPFIEKYFDETMIMVEDEAVKNNRLSQLKAIDNRIKALADMSQLNYK